MLGMLEKDKDTIGRRLLFIAMLALVMGLALSAGMAFAGPAAGVGSPISSPGTCPPEWQIVPSPNQGSSGNHLNSAATVSSDDVWAVGDYFDGSEYRTLTEHWDGTTWSIVPSPNQGSSTNELYSVAALSSTDVWAVGYYGNGATPQTLIEHWNGTSWGIVPSPSPGIDDNRLYSVAAVSPTDVWAVGYYDNFPEETLIEHWNGITWSIVPGPNPSPYYNQLNSIAALSSTDVWAVGYYWNTTVSRYRTLAEHWNGTTWSIVPSPNPGSSDNYLNSVAVLSSTDVWTVGEYQNDSAMSQTLIEHWDGTTWNIVPSPNPGSSYNALQSVAAVSPTDVWTVGYYSNFPDQTLVEHWDGTTWSIVPSPNQGSGNNRLNSVAALSSTDVWTVGYYWDTDLSPTQTLVERYNPCPPTPTPTPSPTTHPSATPTPSPTMPTAILTSTPTNMPTNTPATTTVPTDTATYIPTYSPTATATPTPNSSCICNLAVPEVTIACNPTGTVHWTAAVSNTGTCSTYDGWTAELQVRVRPNGPYRTVATMQGYSLFMPGNTALNVDGLSDFCYPFTPGTDSMRVAVALDRYRSCKPKGVSTPIPPCDPAPVCPAR